MNSTQTNYNGSKFNHQSSAATEFMQFHYIISNGIIMLCRIIFASKNNVFLKTTESKPHLSGHKSL